MIGKDGAPYFQAFGHDEVHDGDWVQQNGGSITQIDCGADGTDVWAVTSSQTVWYRTGVTTSHPTGDDWVQIDGALKWVAVSDHG
jgi:hypothetical protein